MIASSRPAEDWPREGAVMYRKYEMCYRKGLPLVLKGVSCHIQPRQKIGIVGRTGSGKQYTSSRRLGKTLECLP